MKRASSMLIVVFTALASLSPATAAVRVIFVAPEHYRDFDNDTTAMRTATLNELRHTLEEEGARYLKPNQTLTIKIFDVTRAGMAASWSPTNSDLRIVGGATPPRFDVQYTLQQNGKAIRHGHEIIADIDYALDPTAALSSDSLIYEKNSLSNWLRQRFGDQTD